MHLVWSLMSLFLTDTAKNLKDSLAKIAKIAKKNYIGDIFEFPGALGVLGVLARDIF